jgi:hypothetical protein
MALGDFSIALGDFSIALGDSLAAVSEESAELHPARAIKAVVDSTTTRRFIRVLSSLETLRCPCNNGLVAHPTGLAH